MIFLLDRIVPALFCCTLLSRFAELRIGTSSATDERRARTEARSVGDYAKLPGGWVSHLGAPHWLTSYSSFSGQPVGPSR